MPQLFRVEGHLCQEIVICMLHRWANLRSKCEGRVVHHWAGQVSDLTAPRGSRVGHRSRRNVGPPDGYQGMRPASASGIRRAVGASVSGSWPHGASSPSRQGAASTRRHIAWLDEEIARIDVEYREALHRSAVLSQQAKLYRSVPGVGELTAATLSAQLPELRGRRQRKVTPPETERYQVRMRF